MSDYIKREDALFVAYQQPFSSVVTQIKMLDGIDIENDYVPREFHDRVCEEMAKRHIEEIASMPDIVRCRECRRQKSCVTFEGLGSLDGFCSMGERSE